VKGKPIEFDLNISPDGVWFGGTLLPLPRSLSPQSKIGAGANGFVIRCQNVILDRAEAVKFWVKLREGDTRDELKRGVEEAKKAASISSARIAHVYSAGTVLDKYFYVSMEYCEGKTLRDLLVRLPKSARASNPFPHYQYRYNIAIEYPAVIQETAEYGLLHGDAHPGNVIVKVSPLKHGKRLREWPPTVNLKLLDFGTSIFNDKGSSVDRHWRIVDKTMDQILGTHDGYEDMKSEKPPRCEPERLIDFYRTVLLRLSYEYANHKHPIPHKRPLKKPT